MQVLATVLATVLTTAILSESISARDPEGSTGSGLIIYAGNVPRLDVHEAQVLASKILASAGVKIDWRSRHSRAAGKAIQINFQDQTPANEFPGALAKSFPFGGTQVVVFYDRIKRKFPESARVSVLAHVLAHEIIHVLTGSNWHAETGVMKAYWTREDYIRMIYKPLSFTAADLSLISEGLKTWTVRSVARGPSSSAVAVR
jgi:hypothetical protein